MQGSACLTCQPAVSPGQPGSGCLSVHPFSPALPHPATPTPAFMASLVSLRSRAAANCHTFLLASCLFITSVGGKISITRWTDRAAKRDEEKKKEQKATKNPSLCFSGSLESFENEKVPWCC